MTKSASPFFRRLRLFWKRHHASLCFGIPAVLALIWMTAIEPRRLAVRDYEVALPGLPPGLDGFTIAVLSDIHLKAGTLRRFPGWVETVNRRGPDLVVMLGDFVNGYGDNDPALSELSDAMRNFHAPYGVFAVLGNHDLMRGAGPVARALAAGDVRLLREEAVALKTPHGELNLIGLDYRDSGFISADRRVRSLLRKNTVNLLLSHTPDVFPDLPADVGLTLAGHTHGGQLRLPFYGSLLQFSRYGKRYLYGQISEGGKQLVVTGGLGGSLNIRFNMPPEIVFIRLRVAK